MGEPYKNKTVLKLALFVAFLAILLSFAKVSGLDAFLDKDRLYAWIRGYGSWGPLLYLLIYSITPALFLPALPITLVAGAAFGPVLGTFYALVGATLGAALPFFIARHFARIQVEKLLQGKFKAIDEGVERQGWIFVAFTRLIPLFPYNFLNYAFGLTKIPLIHYLAASFISMFPATAAYVVFSSSFFDLLMGEASRSTWLAIFFLVLVFSLPLAYKKRKKKKPPPET